ncbi:unnamed protein product [Rotaria sordida]|uniref:Uncharacterized protein n=1 Tax=Rotaria sordida TaxID=392033 RepID=A0A819LXK0_9BILA|nr:unnamed protein product [Rotaria sordida]
MSSLLISIQSLLSPNPYHDEPDFEQNPFGERHGSFQYLSILTHLQQLKSKLEINKLSNRITTLDEIFSADDGDVQ